MTSIAPFNDDDQWFVIDKFQKAKDGTQFQPGEVVTGKTLRDAGWWAGQLQKMSRPGKNQLVRPATGEEISTAKQKSANEETLEAIPVLPPTEGELALLKSPDLLKTLCAEASKSIVPDENVVRAIVLIGKASCYCSNAKPESSNLCVNSRSGAGKDAHVKASLRPLCEQEVTLFHRTKITPQAFTYWKQKEMREDGFTWDGKTVVVEDCSSALLNSDVFKTMASGGSRATIVKEQNAKDIIIKGKPAIVITTAENEPPTEMLRRFPIVNLVEDDAMTEKIMEFTAERAQERNVALEKPFAQALAGLERVNVVVPFARAVAKALSAQKALPFRTHMGRILDLVKFSAALHQKQRARNERGDVIAQLEDWDNARPVIEAITSSTGTPLTHKQKALLKLLPEKVLKSAPELLQAGAPYTERGIYKTLEQLCSVGVLKQEFVPQEKRKDVRCFMRVEGNIAVRIPTSEEIGEKSSGGFSSGENQRITELVELPELEKCAIEGAKTVYASEKNLVKISSVGAGSTSSSVSSGGSVISKCLVKQPVAPELPHWKPDDALVYLPCYGCGTIPCVGWTKDLGKPSCAECMR